MKTTIPSIEQIDARLDELRAESAALEVLRRAAKAAERARPPQTREPRRDEHLSASREAVPDDR